MDKIISYFTLKFKRFYFVSNDGRSVYVYQDCYGVEYMKFSRWGFHAIKRNMAL